MLRFFFRAAAVLAALTGTSIAMPEGTVDFGSSCGLIGGDSSIVDFAFGGPGGPRTVADGEIVTGTLTLNDEFLNTPPSSVAISAPGVKCGRGKFDFDPSDPSTFEQQVTCRTDGGSVLLGKDGSLVDIAMMFNFEFNSTTALALQVMQKLCQKMLYQRLLGSSGKGGGVGDPHLTTLDRVNYDFQKPGVFRLFESRNLLVQIFQEKCAPVAFRGEAAPSCYQGVAVAFAGSVAKFFIQNGKIQLGKGTSSLGWLSVERLKGKTDGYRVFIAADQATYIDIALSTWINNYPFLNVALQISPYFKGTGVQGLLGNWNGNPSDDLRDNNRLASLHGVSITDNLFTCVGADCVKFLKPATIKDDMAKALPNDLALLHQSFTAVDPTAILLQAFNPVLVPFVKTRHLRTLGEGSAAGVVHPAQTNDTITFPPEAAQETEVPTKAEPTTEPLTAEPPRADVTLRAHELCTHVLGQMSTCDKYVGNRNFYVDTVCVGDSVQLGDLSVVDSTKLNYLRECRRELDARIESNTSTVGEMQAMLADRVLLAFGDLTTCANNCSGQGTCLAAGCKCSTGFTGIACDVAI